MDDMKQEAEKYFNKLLVMAEKKNIEETAFCWNDIIKKTYALAEEEGNIDEDKEEIEDTLKGMQILLEIMFECNSWDSSEIEKFNNIMKELHKP